MNRDIVLAFAVGLGIVLSILLVGAFTQINNLETDNSQINAQKHPRFHRHSLWTGKVK